MDPHVFSYNIDLGHLIVSSCVLVIGFFLRRELMTLTARLDNHDALLQGLIRDVSRMIGASEARERFRLRAESRDE